MDVTTIYNTASVEDSSRVPFGGGDRIERVRRPLDREGLATARYPPLRGASAHEIKAVYVRVF